MEKAQTARLSFAYGVASVTLCTLMVSEGRVAEVATRYRDLITHWLRSGTWTQLWVTLRNAALLLEEHDPALCVEVLDAAANDPLASGMDDEVAATFAEVRDRARARLDADSLGALDMRTLTADRAELAARVRESLHAISH